MLMICSCETEEQKINKAKEAVQTFMTNVSFDNYDVMFKLYPSFRNVKTYWKLKEFNIISATLNDSVITIIGSSGDSEVLFVVEKVNNKYIITNSKGLSTDFNTNLYKYCKKIGCIGTRNYDEDISNICEENEFKFNQIINSIKNEIEESVYLSNHTVTKNYGWTGGEITFKNHSRYSIPSNSYNLYVNYTDSQGNLLFTSKEMLNYENIQFGQSKTIRVFESNSRSFQKVGISLKITNTSFIENIIAEYAEGYNCVYSGNL